MLGNFRKVKLDGEELPEGQVVLDWFDKRFNNNGNVLLVVIGATGSGKSWMCIRLLELWYKRIFNEPLPAENIVFSLNEAGRKLKEDTLRKKEFIIVEEAGVILNSLDFQNKIVKLFGAFLQSARCRNQGIIFNLPSLSLLTKTARILAHGIFVMDGIDRVNGKSYFKPFSAQTNALYGKTYTKYLKQQTGYSRRKIKRVGLSMPSIEVIKPYEERKQKFVSNVLDDFIEGSEEEAESKMTKELSDAAEKLYNNGYKFNEIAKELHVSPKRLVPIRNMLFAKGKIDLEYAKLANNLLENKVLATQKTILTPT